MNLTLQIIASGWFSCLFVQMWKDNLWQTKHLKTLKPFSCQGCMGFWLGLIFFFQYPLADLFTLSCMSSLSAVMLYHLSNIIAKHNTSI